MNVRVFLRDIFNDRLFLMPSLSRNGKFFTASFSALSKDPAAIGRFHAFTETMLISFLSLGRLIGPFLCHSAYNFKICISINRGLLPGPFLAGTKIYFFPN